MQAYLSTKPNKPMPDENVNPTLTHWVSPELFETQKLVEKCIHSGCPKHSTLQCIQYTCTNFPTTLLFQQMEDKSNASAPSAVSNNRTCVPLLVTSSSREDGTMGALIVVIGLEAIKGNIRGHTIASDFIKAEGCLRQPEISHVMPIIVWNGKTGFIPHCPWSLDMRSTWKIAPSTSTHRLSLYMQGHGYTPSQ